MSDLVGNLERLSNEFGPSGNETAVRNLIIGMLRERGIKQIEVDAMGNLVAFKPARPEAGSLGPIRVMIAAHMDEVGFMVTRVGKGGQLSFSPTGIDARLLLGKRVVVGKDRLPGVIGATPPHLQGEDAPKRSPNASELSIDIGAVADRAAEARVKLGDYAVFATRFTTLSDDPAWPTVRGKAFDDRAGCAALVALLEETLPVDLYAVFTVQEEVGLRGAKAAAQRIHPDCAIALEGTICDDLARPPDDDDSPVTRLGDGPAITLMDRSMVTHPGLLRLFRAVAKESDGMPAIPLQYKAPGLGSTDAGAIQITEAGVPAITVATPCRYIHGPAAILNVNDLEAEVRLVARALHRLDRTDLSIETAGLGGGRR